MTEDLYYYDSNWLVERSPYMRLISEQASKRFLDHLYDIMCEYSYLLKEYPRVKYEQVDELYYINLNLSILDARLASDFFQCSFRGACWASLLITINPHEKFLGLLNKFLEECHPSNKWIASLALCSITKEHHEYHDKMNTIRKKFKLLKKESINLRLSPSNQEKNRHSEEILQLRKSYKVNGTGSTLRLLMAKDIYQYKLNFNEWLLSNKRLNKK